MATAAEAYQSLENIKAKLREEKDLGDHIKSDLYSHLTEVFSRIMQYHQTDAYDRFEEISNLVKKTNLRVSNPKFDHELKGSLTSKSTNQEAIAVIEKAKSLLKEKIDAAIDKSILSSNQKFTIPNLAEQASILEWAGINFGDDNTYLLQKSIKRLAIMSGATSIKFFGKIFGTEKDYWIAQGVLPFQEEKPQNQNQEQRGEGANANVYWVTDNLLQDWIQLPEATPEHVQIARLLRHNFTGNLNATIDSCPPFPGKERHLLRAQLARITHGAEICPKGIYEIDEETQQVKLAEEAPALGTEELKSLEIWAHMHPILLKAGRCSHVPPKGVSDEERDEILAKLAEDDKVEERFKALQEDAPVKGLETAWLSKVCGDTQQYNKDKGGEGTNSYAVNIIRSLRWPGAVTVSKGGKFCSIYVGDGIKSGDSSFNPTEPPEVQSDPQDGMENPEPTPLTAPEDPPEPDTDAEKNAEGEEEEN